MPQEHLNAIYNLWLCTVNIKKLTDEESRKHTGKYTLFICNLRCPKCNVAISCAASLTRHMKAEHEGFKFDCGTCGKEYSSIEVLCKHAKKKHSMHKFRYEKCDRTFVFKSQLTKHAASHKEAGTYMCDECGNLYKTVCALRVHMEIHSQLQYICEKCGYTVKKKGLLAEHMLSRHSETRRYTCVVYKTSFNFRSQLARHKNQSQASKCCK